MQVLGNHYGAKLVAVREDTDYLNVQGFVGKPFDPQQLIEHAKQLLPA